MSEAILPGVLGFLSRQFLYSSALFLVILPVTLFIRNRWPLLRQGLWALFFIRLVLPVDLSAPFSLRQLIAPESISTLAQVKLETSEHNASTPVRPAIPEGPAPGFGLQSQGTHEEVAPGQRMSIVDWANFSSKTSWQILVIALWILGAVFCAYIVFRKYTGYRRAARKASEIAVPGILNIVQNWRSKLAVHRQVKILVTELPVSPFTMGILQPRVVLPRFVVELGDEALLESIVAHELSHIKRFDALWLFVQNLLNVVYFFHPGVW